MRARFDSAWLWAAVPIGILIWLLFSAEPKLILWPDSIGYLGPALDAIDQGRFTHWNGRTFGYSLSLWGWLSLAPEPTAIVQGQRVLVGATGVAIVTAMWLLARGAAAWTPAIRAVAMPLLGFWILVFVLYPPTIGLPHIVMAEVLFSFTLALMLLAVVWLAIAESPRQAAGAAAFAAFASTALYIVKPHWMFGAIAMPIVLPLLVPRGRRTIVAIAIVAALGLSWLVLLRPEWQLQRQYDAYASVVFGPRSLFCNSADLVHDYLAARPGSVDARVEQSLAALLTGEARRRAIGWDLVGFDGDACMHGETARLVREVFADRPDEEISFYSQTYVGALVERPWYLAARVGRHFTALAMKPFNAVSGEYFLRADDRSLGANQHVSPMLRRWQDEQRHTFNGLVEVPTRRVMLGLRWFFGIAGLLLTVGTGLATVVLLVDRRGQAPALARTLVLLLVAALSLNFLITGAGTLEPRLVVMQMPLLVLAGFTSSLMCAAGWQNYRTWRR